MICNCCGENKSSTYFSTSRNSVTGLASHCKECGVWLSLFRQVFPKTRDWERNRALTRQRVQSLREKRFEETPRGNPMTELYQAWGIGK